MKLEQSFTVRAPAERVWEALVDVQRVAPCLPGAEITEVGADGSYQGNFTVKLGPTTASYRGELHLESADEAAHVATMRASGQDKRGQGGAKATIVSTLVDDGGATRVDVVTDFSITGRLARFGRGGMIQDVSNRLLRDFATCLQEHLEAEEEARGGVQAAGPAPDVAVSDTPGTAGAGASGEASPAADATAGDPSAATAAPAGAPGPAAPSPAQAPAASAPPPTSARPPRAAPAAPARPVRGFSLLLSVLWERIRRAVASRRRR